MPDPDFDPGEVRLSKRDRAAVAQAIWSPDPKHAGRDAPTVLRAMRARLRDLGHGTEVADALERWLQEEYETGMGLPQVLRLGGER